MSSRSVMRLEKTYCDLVTLINVRIPLAVKIHPFLRRFATFAAVMAAEAGISDDFVWGR